MLSFLIVGDDVLGVPFIKISLRFARAVGDACPYKICGSFDILSVGHDILGVPSIKISFCLKGPSICKANMDARSLQVLVKILIFCL